MEIPPPTDPNLRKIMRPPSPNRPIRDRLGPPLDTVLQVTERPSHRNGPARSVVEQRNIRERRIMEDLRQAINLSRTQIGELRENLAQVHSYVTMMSAALTALEKC